MADFFDTFDAKRNPAPLNLAAPAAVTPGRDVTAYAAAALNGEVDNIRAVPIGQGRNDQLNKSAVKMGHLIAAGAIDERTVTEALGAADGGLDYPATRKTIASGLAFGMQQAKIIPDRQDTPPWLLDTPTDDPFGTTSSTSSNGSATPATSSSPGGNSAESSNSNATGSGSPASTNTATNGSTDTGSEKTRSELIRERFPVVNWAHAWHAKTEIEWITEPLLAARRQVVIYSPAKVGKSLLMLEIAYGICSGGDVLGTTPARPYRVLYVDFENDLEDDIIPRLRNMGATPEELGRLKYLSLPSMAALDTEQGALELVAAVDEYECEVVVIDTISRAVSGDENENDTWLRFYRHTGLKLKQRRVAMIRLDHTGKDEAKGQRGGSAKTGDIDAVWRMMRLTDGNDGQPETFRLVCELKRFPISETVLTLVREEGPLRHTVKPVGARDIIVAAIIAHLDDTDTPLKAGRDAVNLADVKSAVPGATQRLLTDAIKQRRTMHGEPDEAAA